MTKDMRRRSALALLLLMAFATHREQPAAESLYRKQYDRMRQKEKPVR
ncbi:hypothetical protein LJK87_17580 [Paenibacillus sp. P25]|nr:hypothetical protein LJK87_17580 [Paenibacillus sp. P25]